MAYVLSCCSTSDLDADYYVKRDIKYTCYHFTLGDKEYEDNFGKSIPLDEFYKKMEEGLMTRTFQVSAGQFEEYFEGFLKQGLDVLHVCLSSGISGVGNSANTARDMLAEKYPDRKVIIIDSLLASSGYGLFMDYLADKRDEGMSLEDLAKLAEEKRKFFHAWFFSTDLKYYVRGGRVSKVSGFVGTVLHICPMLHMDFKGRLIPVQKIISKGRAKKEIVKRMLENAKDGANYSGKCYISHSACLEDAEDIKKDIIRTFPNLKEEPKIFPIGTTIGCHSGPGTLAVFFEGIERVY